MYVKPTYPDRQRAMDTGSESDQQNYTDPNGSRSTPLGILPTVPYFFLLSRTNKKLAVNT
jgi:hypothetical protein